MKERACAIVVTGGPGGGKTTLMRELRAADPHARRWLLVPEAAPLLFQAGLSARDKTFQRAVMQLQIALEDICAQAANSDQVLICHRGTLDPLAYWLRSGWDEREFFAMTQTTRAEHFARYAAVIHLQTAALGAEPFYLRYPQAHRPETIEQAAATDQLCARAWSQHPCYVLITNDGRDWESRSRAAHETLLDALDFAREHE
ncbi:MAG: AAA family ATPase [Chloroflexi bacterium]|nr:AAA family ATPase [Chloroflexota bacterium]